MRDEGGSRGDGGYRNRWGNSRWCGFKEKNVVMAQGAASYLDDALMT